MTNIRRTKGFACYQIGNKLSQQTRLRVE